MKLQLKETLTESEMFEKKIMEKEVCFNKKANNIKTDIKMLERYENLIADCTDSRQLEKLNYYEKEVIANIETGMDNL